MNFRTLILSFSVVLSIECLANAFGLFALQFFSKPSLMILLLIYFVQNSKPRSSSRKLIIFALFFSWLGDVLLLLEKSFEELFTFGLIAFLIAHIFYVLFFVKIGKQNLDKRKIKYPALLLVLIYSIGFYWLLYPNLSSLAVPVLIYSVLISLMLVACIHAFDYEKQNFGWVCLAGTILFAVSDSILAFNRFVEEIPLGGVLVILLYGMGQLLITEGALRNLRRLS